MQKKISVLFTEDAADVLGFIERFLDLGDLLDHGQAFLEVSFEPSTSPSPFLKDPRALPRPAPISGSFLLPKMRKAINRIIISSGVPSPNIAATGVGG